MIQIRNSIFETNSSSTHSLTLCSGEDYKKWEKKQLYFDSCKEVFVKPSEIEIDLATIEDYLDRGCSLQDLVDDYTKNEGDIFRSPDDYFERYGEAFETFCQRHYNSKSGEETVAFGHYGYDG